MNKLLRQIIFIYAIVLSACNNTSDSSSFIHEEKYLEQTIKYDSKLFNDHSPIYLINLASCSGCLDINFKYLINNCYDLNIEIVLIGNYKGSIWENEIKEVLKCYNVTFDERSLVNRYNISTSKPLLIKFNENGKVDKTINIHEHDIEKLVNYIDS